jgi:hypothetical protein
VNVPIQMEAEIGVLGWAVIGGLIGGAWSVAVRLIRKRRADTTDRGTP